MNVGFLGLGAMGRPIANNLLKAGHKLRVWNRTQTVADALAAVGAEPVAAPHLATGEVVFSMLADDGAVRSVVLDSGFLDALPPGTIHVNMATISIALAEQLAAEHERRGTHYIAAPVFGRPDAAAAAQLNIVVAGDDSALERIQPLFDVIGQRTWRVGAYPRQANALKLAGNFLIVAAIEAIAEATTMTEHYDVPAAEVLNVLTNTLFAAPVYKNYGALIAGRKYEPAGFPLALGLKDVRLVLEAAEAARTPMPFASIARDHFLEAVARGEGERDWSALAEVVRRHAGRTA